VTILPCGEPSALYCSFFISSWLIINHFVFQPTNANFIAIINPSIYFKELLLKVPFSVRNVKRVSKVLVKYFNVNNLDVAGFICDSVGLCHVLFFPQITEKHTITHRFQVAAFFCFCLIKECHYGHKYLFSRIHYPGTVARQCECTRVRLNDGSPNKSGISTC